MTSSGGGGAATKDAFVGEYCRLVAPPCCAKYQRTTDGTQCQLAWNAAIGHIKYDPTKADQCLSEVRAALSSSEFCEETNRFTPTCDLMTDGAAGTVAPGSTCTKESDCASAPDGDVECVFARSDGGGSTRVCQVQVQGKEGDSPCVETKGDDVDLLRPSPRTSVSATPPRGFTCHKGAKLYCDDQTGACTRTRSAGETCESSTECERDLLCDSQKKCSPRAAVGADCTGVTCVKGARCNPSTRKCETLIADGAACTTNESCASSSCVNGNCEENSLAAFAYGILCGRKNQ